MRVRGPVRPVGIARKALQRGGTLCAASVAIVDIEMAWEPATFGTSIVANLEPVTLLGRWHPPRVYGFGRIPV
jgi:hypothetical protein